MNTKRTRTLLLTSKKLCGWWFSYIHCYRHSFTLYERAQLVS